MENLNFKVAKIIDSDLLVLNAGKNEGIKKGFRFLIYSIGNEEIKDPDTGESLGFLEIVKGIGRVNNVQEKMCTVVSDEFESTLALMDKVRKPFYRPKVGDHAKYIA